MTSYIYLSGFTTAGSQISGQCMLGYVVAYATSVLVNHVDSSSSALLKVVLNYLYRSRCLIRSHGARCGVHCTLATPKAIYICV